MRMTSRPIRACAFAILGALFLLPRDASAAAVPLRVPPSAEYLNRAARYTSADHAEAVRALKGWSDERLRCDLDNLQAAAVAVSRCRRGSREDRVASSASPSGRPAAACRARDLRSSSAFP